MSDLLDYDEFYDALMANYAAMREVALDRLATEEILACGSVAVPSWTPGAIPGGFGNVEAVDFEGCENAFSELASTYLCADYREMESMVKLLDGAMLSLNGPTDGSAGTGMGIDPIIGDIYGGLSSWDSEAGEVFTTNFVDTIGGRKTNQFNAVDYANRGVLTGMELVFQARLRALRLPLDAKKALEDYNPWSWLLWSGAKLGLIGLGLGANTAGNLLIAVTDNQLVAPDKELTVAGLIAVVIEAVGKFAENVRSLENHLADDLNAESNRVETEWGGHVCSRPTQVESQTSGDDLVV